MTPIHRIDLAASQADGIPASRAANDRAAAQARSTMQAVTFAATEDMLTAARLEDALNHAQTLAKLMESGPKAAKDLLAQA
ncbi:serine kinase/phosphatase [Ralstonia mannitolilytica]|uniref:Serine kinase/phosphatase n=1 Tax=Ralstonia mannitolilytica TaxID=105219 RepID=A0AAD2EK04_9RALS|nr:serine kinase/phosphatase [Ralstonia mannitolilytica]CAJ0687398.1 hypothetical protein R77591_03075 [Ralstonia mannitolilytica]CAJ0796343.1 hypothetical protein LMG18090_03408 [Ralstonia mannitolilytica]CAJ0886582.1 hypothetical protein R77569_03731 [Ralstonia mannitolilytica]